MANQTQTKTATCPNHGNVQATRELPGPSFPFFVYAIRRFISSRRPYRCPTCGATCP